MEVVPEDEADANAQKLAEDEAGPLSSASSQIIAAEDLKRTETPEQMTPADVRSAPTKSYKDSLKSVLDLHTSRRMKASSSPNKVRQGVSIPSQRRWLHYWSLILAHEAPSHLWPMVQPKPPYPKVRLTEIKVRMREASTVKMGLVRAANMVMEYTSSKNASISKLSNGKKGGQVWVSLARYDDEFVDLLERWEVHTRDVESGHMGRRRKGSEYMGDEAFNKIFEDGKWDTKKMVRSFARMGAVGDQVEKKEGDQKITTYTLRPLNGNAWDGIRHDLAPANGEPAQLDELNIPASENNSMYDVTQTLESDRGIILDATREVRVKLYMGQVFMGWFWFIPTLHMSPLSSAKGLSTEPAKLILTRKEIDFPLGIGSAIVDVEVPLEWVPEAEALRQSMQPPARETSLQAREEGEKEPTGYAPTLMGESIEEAVKAKQAAED